MSITMYTIENSSINGLDRVTLRMAQQMIFLVEQRFSKMNSKDFEWLFGDIWCALYTHNANYRQQNEWLALFENKAFHLFMRKTAGNKLLTTISSIQLLEEAQQRGRISNIEQCCQRALKTFYTLEQFVKGLSASEKTKLSFEEQLVLAYELKEDTKLQEVAYWANLFKITAKKKRLKKREKTILKANRVNSAKLERLYPYEFLKAESAESALDFTRRLAESTIHTYANKTKELATKGAFIVCFDESGSMRELDSQGKGFILALLAIAQRDKRDFIFIPFSGAVDEKEIQVFPQGRSSRIQLTQLAKSYSGGGTNFKNALNYAMEYMKQSKKNGDLLFITDGISHLDDLYIEQFVRYKKAKRFHMTSLIIGLNKHPGVLPNISDDLIKISQFIQGDINKVFTL